MTSNVQDKPRKKINKDIIVSNPDFLKMKFYSIQELAIFGIGEKTLYSWYSQKFLVPFTFSGSIPKFRYEDFLNACQLANQMNQETKNIPINTNIKLNKEDILDRISEKFLKKKKV